MDDLFEENDAYTIYQTPEQQETFPTDGTNILAVNGTYRKLSMDTSFGRRVYYKASNQLYIYKSSTNGENVWSIGTADQKSPTNPYPDTNRYAYIYLNTTSLDNWQVIAWADTTSDSIDENRWTNSISTSTTTPTSTPTVSYPVQPTLTLGQLIQPPYYAPQITGGTVSFFIGDLYENGDSTRAITGLRIIVGTDGSVGGTPYIVTNGQVSAKVYYSYDGLPVTPSDGGDIRDTVSTDFTYTVIDTPPLQFGYASASLTLTVGNQMNTITPSSTVETRYRVTGGTYQLGVIVSYAMTDNAAKSLFDESGLSFNTTTGAISGTPSSAFSALGTPFTVEVVATNSGGSATATVSITINDAPPGQLSYPTLGPWAPLTVGTAVTFDPTIYGGPVTSWSISPNLPPNLSFDTSTGVISGTPEALQAQTDYTITASNTGGSTSTTPGIIINAVPPSDLAYADSPFSLTIGSAMNSATPTSNGGPIVSYTMEFGDGKTWFDLAGLVLNTTTGEISGSPSTSFPSDKYGSRFQPQITGHNSGGTTEVTIDITINDIPPSNLTYPDSPFSFTTGYSTYASPRSTGGAVVSYTMTDNGAKTSFDSAGLSFDETNGAISGTPVASFTGTGTAFTPEITATNSGGTATATISITVYQPPAITLTLVDDSGEPIAAATTSNGAQTVDGPVVYLDVSGVPFQTPLVPSDVTVSSGITVTQPDGSSLLKMTTMPSALEAGNTVPFTAFIAGGNIDVVAYTTREIDGFMNAGSDNPLPKGIVGRVKKITVDYINGGPGSDLNLGGQNYFAAASFGYLPGSAHQTSSGWWSQWSSYGGEGTATAKYYIGKADGHGGYTTLPGGTVSVTMNYEWTNVSVTGLGSGGYSTPLEGSNLAVYPQSYTVSNSGDGFCVGDQLKSVSRASFLSSNPVSLQTSNEYSNFISFDVTEIYPTLGSLPSALSNTVTWNTDIPNQIHGVFTSTAVADYGISPLDTIPLQIELHPSSTVLTEAMIVLDPSVSMSIQSFASSQAGVYTFSVNAPMILQNNVYEVPKTSFSYAGAITFANRFQTIVTSTSWWGSYDDALAAAQASPSTMADAIFLYGSDTNNTLTTGQAQNLQLAGANLYGIKKGAGGWGGPFQLTILSENATWWYGGQGASSWNIDTARDIAVQSPQSGTWTQGQKHTVSIPSLKLGPNQYIDISFNWTTSVEAHAPTLLIRDEPGVSELRGKYYTDLATVTATIDAPLGIVGLTLQDISASLESVSFSNLTPSSIGSFEGEPTSYSFRIAIPYGMETAINIPADSFAGAHGVSNIASNTLSIHRVSPATPRVTCPESIIVQDSSDYAGLGNIEITLADASSTLFIPETAWTTQPTGEDIIGIYQTDLSQAVDRQYVGAVNTQITLGTPVLENLSGAGGYGNKIVIPIESSIGPGSYEFAVKGSSFNYSVDGLTVPVASSTTRAGPYTVIPSDKATLTLSSSSYATGSPSPGSTTSNNIISLTFRSLFPMAIDVTTANEANKQAVRTDPHLEGNPFPSVIGTSGTAQVSTIDGGSQLVFYLDVSLCTILAPPLSAVNGGYDVNFYLPLLYGTAECVFLDRLTSAITADVTVEPVVGNVSGLSPSPSFKSINSWTKWIYDPIAGFDVTLETTTPYVNTEASLTLTIPSAAQIGVNGDASGNLTEWFSSVPPSNFTITDVNEAGTTWSIAADPQGPDGLYLVTLAEGIVFQGETFNNPVDCSFTYLDEPMTVSITSADANKTISTETFPFTIISSSQAESGHETISKEDFDITSTNTSGVAHLAITIDAPTNIDPPSQSASYLPRRTQWQGSATVHGDGTYTISLKAGILTDIFGNSQAASNVLSWRFQELTPRVTISADATLGPRVTRKSVGLTFTLNQSGVAFAESDVDVTNVTLSDWEQSTTNPLAYTATATVDVPPESDENVSIACGVSVDQGRLSNAYGTAGSGIASLSWTYVQSQPTVVVALSTSQGSLSGGSWTNSPQVTATFSFDQDVVGFDGDSITVGAPSGVVAPVPTAPTSDGTNQYKSTIIVVSEGLYTISVPANVVNSDNVSNAASNVATWHYQNEPPRLSDFYSPDVSAGQPTTKEDISLVLVADAPLASVDITKCILAPNTMIVKDLSGSDENWTFTVAQNDGSTTIPADYLAQCSVTCRPGALVSSAATGSASSDASFSFDWIYTNAPPRAEISSGLTGTEPKTNQETILLAISCRGNEPMYGFDITKVVPITTGRHSNPGVRIQLVSSDPGAGQPWQSPIHVRASVSTSTVGAVLVLVNGIYGVQVQQWAFSDVNGTGSAASEVYSWDYSDEAPTVHFSSQALDANKGPSYPFPVLKFEMTLSEPCEGVSHDDIVCQPPASVDEGQVIISSLNAVSDVDYTFEVTVPADGEYSIYMPRHKISDGFKNWNKESSRVSWQCVIVGPAVTLSADAGLVSGSETNQEYLHFTATFDQPLAEGLHGNVLIEGGASAVNVVLDASNQQLTFATYADQDKSYSVSLPAGIVKNKYNSDSLASSPFNWTYSNVAPTGRLTTTDIDPGLLTNVSTVVFDISLSEPCPAFAVTDSMLTGSVGGIGSVVNQKWTTQYIHYNFSVNTSAAGDFALLIPASSIVDIAGNSATEALSFNWSYTDIDPTYTVVSDTTGLTFNTSQSSALLSVDALLTFTDKVFPRLSDIVLTNCKITNVSPSGTTPRLSYVFTIEPLEKGHAEVDFHPSAFSTSDLGGVQPASGSTISWTFAPTEPVVTIAGPVQSHALTTRKSIALDITVSPSSVPFEVGDISHSASLAAPSSFSGISTTSGGSQVYSLLFQLADMTPVADFTVDCWVKVAAGAVNNRSQINEAASSFYWTYTNVPPTPVITAVDISDGAYTDINPIRLRIYVPDGISGEPFQSSYITATDPTVVSIAHPRKLIAVQGEQGDTYELDATVTGANYVSLSVRAGAYNDLAGQPNNASNPFTWHYNDAPLTLSVASDIPTVAAREGITNESTITLTVTGSLVISSVDVSKIAGTGGATFTYRVKSATTYQFEVSLGSSPSDGTYTMSFDEGAFTDRYGRLSGQASFGWIYSNVPPVPTIQPVVPLGPGQITNRESVAFNVTFNQSGVTVSKPDFRFSPASASFSYKQEGTVYKVTVDVGAQSADVTVPCTLSLPKGSVHDRAGNVNVATGEYAWTYTNSPPVPTISHVGDGSLINNGFTHLDTNVFKVAVDDAVTIQPTVMLTGPSGTTQVLSTTSGSADYSMMVQVTTSQEGSYTLKVPAAGVVDTAGNKSAVAPEWSWTYNDTRPSVAITAKAAGSGQPLVSGDTINVDTVDVKFVIDEPTAPGSFTIGDVQTTDGLTLSSWVPLSDTVYNVMAYAGAGGTFSIQVPADKFTDRAGLSNLASNELSWSYSKLHPTPTITAQSSMSLTTGGKTIHDVMKLVVDTIRQARVFGQSAIRITDSADAVLTGYTMTASSSGSTLYDVSIPVPAAGTYQAQVLGDAYEDRAGNENLASLPFKWEYEGSAPDISLSSLDVLGGKVYYTSTITVLLSSSVDITMPFKAAFLLTEGVTISSIAGTPGGVQNRDYTLVVRTFKPADGEVFTISLPAGGAQNIRGRASNASTSLSWEYVGAVRISLAPVSRWAVPNVFVGTRTAAVRMDSNASLTGVTSGALVGAAGVDFVLVGETGGKSFTFQVTAPAYGAYVITLPIGHAVDTYGGQNTSPVMTKLIFTASIDSPWFRHYASAAGIDLGCVGRPLGCPPRALYNPQNTGYVTPIRGEIARQAFMVGMASRAPGRTRSVVEGQVVNAFGSNAGAPAGARGPIRNSFI